MWLSGNHGQLIKRCHLNNLKQFTRKNYTMNDKCVVLNAKKMNFDGKLDFSVLSSDVTVYDDTGMRKS